MASLAFRGCSRSLGNLGRQIRCGLNLSAVFALLVGACTSASNEWDPGPIEISESRTPEVIVQADPYVGGNRQAERFGVVLTDGGVLAIEVSVENRSSGPLVVRQSEMSLVLADGSDLITAPAGQVASRIESTPIAQGADVASALIHPFIGVLTLGADEKSQTEQYNLLRDALFGDATIGSGGKAAGFVYFVAPDNKTRLEVDRLTVRIVNVEEGTSFVTRLQF